MTAEEAAAFGDIVVVSVPLHAYREIPVQQTAGKIVVDTNNYYPSRDGQIAELDDDSTTSTELLQAHLPDSRVVKAFNAIMWKHLSNDGRPPGDPGRLGIPISGLMSNTDERSVSSALRWGKRVAPVAVVAALGVGAVAVAAQGGGTVQYRSAGGAYFTSVRPTGVGLPQIGESGTVGAGDLAASLRSYHNSGAYGRDLGSVDGAAQAYLTLRLKQAKAPKGKRVKLTGKPAIVLDIDETSLSNYEGLEHSGFIAAGLAASSVVTRTPINPTLSLYRYARSHRVAVFFVTGRPSLIDAITKANLRAARYTKGWNGLLERPAGARTETFKAGARQKIQRQGFDIVANVGDQESELDGGHADRAFKLPDPYYFIAD